MSDTVQMVRWSLDAGEPHYLWPPREGSRRAGEILGESIRRANLQQALGDAFQMTTPLWYGFWMESPLTRHQCSLLHQLLSDVAAHAPRYGERLQEFIAALATAADTGSELEVKLMPPGHVDLGWVTIFVHCPRCKAEGPFKRWQTSYPEEPIDCPICGHSYSPAATYSAERQYFSEFVRCAECQSSFPTKGFSEADISILEHQHYYHEAIDELAWLRRVAAFYQRHPHFEGKIKPHAMEVMESKDAEVRKALWAGVPYDEIELPNAEAMRVPSDWSSEDREVADYLRHHHFSLPRRMKAVEESVRRLEPLARSHSVACPRCGGKIQAHDNQTA